MSTKFKIWIKCDEANYVCDKSQYKESSFWEKIKLNIHFLYCRACRKYSHNNAKLSKVITKSKVKCLDKNCKEAMKKDFEKALKDNSI